MNHCPLDKNVDRMLTLKLIKPSFQCDWDCPCCKKPKHRKWGKLSAHTPCFYINISASLGYIQLIVEAPKTGMELTL